MLDIFDYSPVDCRSEIEAKMKSEYVKLEQLIGMKNPVQVHSLLAVSVDPGLHSALLYGILCVKRDQFFEYLSAVVRDNFKFINSIVQHLLLNLRFISSLQVVENLVWLIGQLGDYDNILLALRSVLTGSLEEKNLRLVECCCILVLKNFDQLQRIDAISYCVLRFAAWLPEKQKLLALKILFRMFESHLNECLKIGLDIQRLVADVPELKHKIDGIELEATHPYYFNLSLTPQLERKTKFLLEFSKISQQKQYLDWFWKSINANDTSFLVSDIIRYVCNVVHPSNAILASDILQRWNFIGFLLQHVDLAHRCVFALVYDWLWYKEDNIMKIEPCILVMIKSLPKYPKIPKRIIDLIESCIEADLHSGIKKALHLGVRDILKKKVVGSLDLLKKAEMEDYASKVDSLFSLEEVLPLEMSDEDIPNADKMEYYNFLQKLFSTDFDRSVSKMFQHVNNESHLENLFSGLKLLLSLDKSIEISRVSQLFDYVETSHPEIRQRLLQDCLDGSLPIELYQKRMAFLATDLVTIKQYYKYCRKLFTSFDVVGSTNFIRMIFRDLDPSKLLEISTDYMFEPYPIIGSTELMLKTVEWESYEQIFLWQVASLEISSFHYKIDPQLLDSFHGKEEALHGFILLLRNIIPTKELVTGLLKVSSFYTRCIWLQWLKIYPEHLYKYYGFLKSIADEEVLDKIIKEKKNYNIEATTEIKPSDSKEYVSLLEQEDEISQPASVVRNEIVEIDSDDSFDFQVRRLLGPTHSPKKRKVFAGVVIPEKSKNNLEDDLDELYSSSKSSK